MGGNGSLAAEGIMKALVARLKNWKTTLGGTALGAIGVAVAHHILAQAGCNFDQVVWADVLVFFFTQLQGLLSTDNGQSV